MWFKVKTPSDTTPDSFLLWILWGSLPGGERWWMSSVTHRAPSQMSYIYWVLSKYFLYVGCPVCHSSLPGLRQTQPGASFSHRPLSWWGVRGEPVDEGGSRASLSWTAAGSGVLTSKVQLGWNCCTCLPSVWHRGLWRAGRRQCSSLAEQLPHAVHDLAHWYL